jgi:hypothetical protein
MLPYVNISKHSENFQISLEISQVFWPTNGNVMNVKFEYEIVTIKFGFYAAGRKLTSRHASASSAPAPWFIPLC